MEAVMSPEARERKRIADREYKRHRWATDPEYRERKRAQKRADHQRRYASDPEFREKRKVQDRESKRRRYHTDPEWRARMNAKSRERQRQLREDPEWVAKEAERRRLSQWQRRAPRPAPATTYWYPAATVLACFDTYGGIAEGEDRKFLLQLRAGEIDRMSVDHTDRFLLRCGLGLYYIEEDPHE